MKSVLGILIAMLLSVNTTLAQDEKEFPRVYFGDVPVSGTIDKSSTLITIHKPSEEGHDSDFTIVLVEMHSNGSDFTLDAAVSDAAIGYELSPRSSALLQKLDSGSTITLLLHVKGADGIERRLAAVFEVR